MKIEIHSFQAPRWIVPVLLLAALALIPFALVLALGLAALTLGVAVLRAFLPSAGQSRQVPGGRTAEKLDDPTAIDADYEVKDAHEKD